MGVLLLFQIYLFTENMDDMTIGLTAADLFFIKKSTILTVILLNNNESHCLFEGCVKIFTCDLKFC